MGRNYISTGTYEGRDPVGHALNADMRHRGHQFHELAMLCTAAMGQPEVIEESSRFNVQIPNNSFQKITDVDDDD